MKKFYRRYASKDYFIMSLTFYSNANFHFNIDIIKYSKIDNIDFDCYTYLLSRFAHMRIEIDTISSI